MSSSAMEAMDELVQLAESMCQAASLLLGDDDPSDESSPRRPSTFLNAVDVVFLLTAAVASAVRVASCSHHVGRHRQGRRQAQIRGEPLQWAAAAASVGFRPGGRG
ncbi:hypothetical protein OsI_15535 [Oryza sativa Indica Group]|uniref:Uncharacterized protein n=1 Tax=Oryza sativa subsp. indica TaxID=39946 RepID=B8AST7_ORYSI|nr:hypothetical protein OsI_15535 [Oryza sativa Indica Group]